MKVAARALALAGALGLGSASAADLAKPNVQVEVGGSYDSLDSGYDDWTSVYLEGAWQRAPRQTLYGAVRRTERFGLADSEALAGAYFPLSGNVTGVVEIGYSPTHEVLPKWSAFGQLEIALAAGFGLQFGGRHTEYAAAYVDQGLATGEYYFANNRVAYTYYRTYLEGDTPVGVHRFAVGHYYGQYGERSTVSLAYGNGKEVESLGMGQVLVTDVRSVVLVGRHWVRPRWALTYEAGQYRSIDRYTRQGVRLGVRHEF